MKRHVKSLSLRGHVQCEGSGRQSSDVDDQTPFRYGRNLGEVDAHALLVHRMADNSLERNVLMSCAKYEHDFRANRKRIGIQNENAFHAYISNRGGPFVIENEIVRLGLKSLNHSSVFFSHILRLVAFIDFCEHRFFGDARKYYP